MADQSRTFRALRISEAGDSTQTTVEELTDADLPGGDVTVDVSYSDLNFKDGKFMEPGARFVTHFPIVPGIDFVGSVTASANPEFVVGDRVVVNGYGLGTDRDGGLTQRTRVPGAWLTRVPKRLDDRRAAAIGTAGYTAGLAVDALADAGVLPSSGPVLVTGAGGGVGSIAIMLLSAAGYDVVASTGRADELGKSLTALGATEVVGRLEDEGPLAGPGWAAAIDSVGSATLAAALAGTRYGGAVATVGLAGGIDLPTTVLPFILRSVSLLGIESVYASAERRRRAWARVANLDLDLLDSITTEVGLADAPRVSQDIVAGRVHGRVVVDVHH
jgi:acrylyl-CoA reductase (NADPH)